MSGLLEDIIQHMDLSIVLWNCNGTDQPRHGRLKERVDAIASTVKSWIDKNDVPNVVLAQECKEKRKWDAWTQLSCKLIEIDQDKGVYCFAPNNQGIIKYENRYDRLHCCVLRTNIIPKDKLLVCSWHGPWNYCQKTEEREKRFKEMLLEVYQLQKEHECSAVLVGGDFNLLSRKAREILSGLDTPKDACLYDDYILPPLEDRLIQYIIGWPKDRFLNWGCEVIQEVISENVESRDPKSRDAESKDTGSKTTGSKGTESRDNESKDTKREDIKSEDNKNENAKLFDHPLVKYDFILLPKRNNVGKGENVWKGVGVGKGRCEGENLKGYWKGVGEGECNVRGIVKYKQEIHMKIEKDGKKVKWIGRGRVAWVGRGEVAWECTTKESEVSLYGVDQTVCLMKKINSLKMDGKNPVIYLDTVHGVSTWKFPKYISQSTHPIKEPSNACTIISLLLCHNFFVHKLKTSNVLREKWVQIMKSCLENGNNYHKESEYSGNLSVDEAKQVIDIHDKTIVMTSVLPPEKCFGNNIEASISSFLNQMQTQENTCITYIVGGKTISFVPGENKSIIMMDSHLHGHYGALIAKFPNAEFQIHAWLKNIGLGKGEPDIQLIKFSKRQQQQRQRRRTKTTTTTPAKTTTTTTTTNDDNRDDHDDNNDDERQQRRGRQRHGRRSGREEKKKFR